MSSPADDAASVSSTNRPKEFELAVPQISPQGAPMVPSSTNSYFLSQPPPPAGVMALLNPLSEQESPYVPSHTLLTIPSVPQASHHVLTNQPYIPYAHSAFPSYAGGVFMQHQEIGRLACINNAAGYLYMGPETSAPTIAGTIHEDDDSDLPTCHLHTKTQLSCRLCRKHRNAVTQKARLAAQQGNVPIRPAEDRRNVIEMTNTTTFGLNNLLQSNILSSEYFRSLFALKTFHEVVDEISRYANHAEPYLAGSQRSPSTFFCCLYKLFLMRLTDKQMRILLEHKESSFVRAIGFLYLRYVHPPVKLWDWFENYFLDDEEFSPSVDTTRIVTIGEYVETLLTEDKYFSTVLPRLPAKLKNQYGAQLITMAEHRTRKQQNKDNIEAFIPAQPVLACHKGTWVEGTLLDVVYPHAGRTSCEVQLKPKNEEDEPEEINVDIGLVVLVPKTRRKRDKEKKRRRDEGTRQSRSPEQGEILEEKEVSSSRRKDESPRGRKRSKGDDYEGYRNGRKSRSSRRRKRSLSRRNSDSDRSRSPARDEFMAANIIPKQMTEEDLRAEFKKRETDKVLATGKDYARRPASYKSSLSAKMTTHVTRRERIPMTEEVDLRSHSTAATSRSKPADLLMPSKAHQAKMMTLMGKYISGQEDQKQTDDTEGVERLGYV